MLNEACQKAFAEEVVEIPEKEVKLVSISLPKYINQILFQLRKSLEDQKSLNISLHGYIDSVLLNIMENSPHLLEILK